MRSKMKGKVVVFAAEICLVDICMTVYSSRNIATCFTQQMQRSPAAVTYDWIKAQVHEPFRAVCAGKDEPWRLVTAAHAMQHVDSGNIA